MGLGTAIDQVSKSNIAFFSIVEALGNFSITWRNLGSGRAWRHWTTLERSYLEGAGEMR